MAPPIYKVYEKYNTECEELLEEISEDEKYKDSDYDSEYEEVIGLANELIGLMRTSKSE